MGGDDNAFMTEDLLFVEEERPGRGRCALASCLAQPGTVVLRERPWATVLSKEQRSLRCDYELENLSGLLKCPVTATCFKSKHEQKRAWLEYYQYEHRACKALKAAGRSFPDLPITLRLAARVLWRGASDRSSPWVSLQQHWDLLSEERQTELRAMGDLCSSVVQKGLPEGSSAPDPLHAAQLLA